MDSITQLIKTEIKKQYKSVRQFSEKSGIPYSTLSNALSKGIGGTSYDTVIKICNLLNLKQAYDTDLTIFNDQCYEICTMLAALDERAVHTLKTVLSIEYERCTNIKKSHRANKKVLMAVENLNYEEASV
ncbi:MAG: helix-turn-helix transcriptional regulator [Clostridia bacterium]|nr:helix-turn-helix transcriptional regulator [Clostridia bacterium]